MTREHTILEGKEMPNDSAHFTKMNELVRCLHHPTAKVVYKCEVHDQFVCIACLAVNHRKCENFVELKNCPVNDTLIRSKFKALCDKATNNKYMKQKDIDSLRFQQEKIENELSAFVEKITDQLRKLNEKMSLETEKEVNARCVEIEERFGLCEQLEQEAISNIQLCDTLMKYGTPEQVAVVSGYLHKKAEELRHNNGKHMMGQIESLIFNGNSILAKTDSIGDVSFSKMSSTESSQFSLLSLSNDEVSLEKEKSVLIQSNPSEAVRAGFEKESLLNRKISSISHSNTFRSPSDKRTCFISGFACLDHKLVVIDKNNKNIKIFSEDHVFLCEKTMSGLPVDVCTVKNNLVVITENVKRLNVYHHEKGSVVKQREILTRDFPLSIASYKGMSFYVLLSEQPLRHNTRKFLVIELRRLHDGMVLNEVDVLKFMKHPDIESNFYRLHYMGQEKIIVSENEMFHTFSDMKEKVVRQWYYKGTKYQTLLGASDIDSDDEGNVYVCGSESKDIHQVACHDFTYSRVISLVGRPSAVFFDLKNSCLITAFENEDRSWVVKFDRK